MCIRDRHYSAVQADVPDPADPTTQLNVGLIKTLENADLVALSGQALSHCVANTIRDIADYFGRESIRKLVLIEDTSSPPAIKTKSSPCSGPVSYTHLDVYKRQSAI